MKLSPLFSIVTMLGIVTCSSALGGNNMLPTHSITLKNGLKVIVREDHRAPIATFNIFYKVGSMDEPNGLTGISHVVEHMMFKGTHAHPGESFNNIISTNGGEYNAFTYTDFTGYYETLAKQKLAIAFELEADRMQHAQMKASDFEKEIEVVKEERRLLEDRPKYITYERFIASAYVANPYRRPVIGWMHDLNELTAKEVRHWYKTWYAPNNATIIVVGDVNPQAVFKMAKRYFGTISQHNLPKRPKFQSLDTIGERHVNVKTPAKVPLIIRGYNVPALSQSEEWEPYALYLLSNILGNGQSAKLSVDLVKTSQVAASVDADYYPLQRAATLFTITAIPSPKTPPAALSKAINQVISELRNQPLSPEALERAKTQLKAKFIYDQDSISRQAYQIARFEMAGLPYSAMDTWIEHIDKLTSEQIQQVAKRFLSANRLTQAILFPQPLQMHTQKGVQHG